jgi:GntR family transcriptional repressor for pyruvate dehydrogenase complex
VPRRKVERVTLIDAVVTQLEDAILAGEYPAAAKLPTEEELAVELAVSRPVIREALARLRERGYVETVNGRGTYVRETRVDAVSEALLRHLRLHVGAEIGVDDLYEARRTIELGAIALAAERATVEDLDELEVGLEDMRTAIAGDPADYTAADVGFHLAIARATHNPLYPLLLSPLIDPIVRGMYRSIQSMRAGMQSGVEEHARILDALRHRDRDAAALQMEAHLQDSRRKHPGFVRAARANSTRRAD